jgi:3-deoxy-D-manno-octulosonic-acid transferase
VSFWNPKARLWIKGRITVFEKLKKAMGRNPQNVVWMHCASLGEFEQGKPVLKLYKENFPEATTVVTFFSPSGYEIIKKKNEFDHVFYLPMDSYINAKRWMKILKPQLVLWVKYEYWHYYLQEINRKDIPLLLISGVYRSDQIFFKWYGGFYREMLKCFTHFFLQNESSKNLLINLVAEEKISVSGDTRCDRVILTAENFKHIPAIQKFCGDYRVIVVGSTWEDDEAIWVHYVKEHPEIKFILAPHEVDKENINDIQKAFEGSILFSEWEINSSKLESNCLIIDNIGMLSKLYNYATITYIGGGFGADGLHNILEPAVFGKPVIFGPEYDKNFEAQELIDCKGALSIQSAIELEEVVDQLFSDKEELENRGNAARNYIYQNTGASQKIIEFIKDKITLKAVR